MAHSTDPIGFGFIQSLAHPGGNITGIASLFGDITGKSIEIIHKILPTAKRIAVLMSNNPTHPKQYELANAAAKNLGIALVPVTAPTPDDLEAAFERMRQENCDALFVLSDPTRPAIVTLAARSKLPAIYQFSNFVDLGGLASYGPAQNPIARTVARYVDKIFKGADPTSLPVEQAVVFELAINLKTAASLGIDIPESVVAMADKVIE
jgi:putative ABC transport system substrate-binding protein